MTSLPSMRDDYTDTFDARGDHYNEAGLIHPLARDIERRILIDLLATERSHTVCDAPAGGGYLADGIRPLLDDPAQITCVEPSERFAAAIDPAYKTAISPLNALPLAAASVDRVGSLAGLHHLSDKQPFFDEAHRVLVSGGRFAVGDVLAGTPVDRFLNGPVDRYTETGHKGVFLEEGEPLERLRNAGFEEASETHRRFYWTFTSEAQMVRYCRSLFGMTKATLGEVGAALEAHFEIEVEGGETRLPWSLVYGVGVKH